MCPLKFNHGAPLQGCLGDGSVVQAAAFYKGHLSRCVIFPSPSLGSQQLRRLRFIRALARPARSSLWILPTSQFTMADSTASQFTMADSTAADLTRVSPPPDYVSSTMPLAPPLRTKPRLEDFRYGTRQFPAAPPPVTRTELDVTISLIATMLDSGKNDMALSFMVDHKVLRPDFSPPATSRCHPARLTLPGCAAPFHAAAGHQAWRGNVGRLSNRTATRGHGHGMVPARSR